MVSRGFRITGVVQGVGFRYWTRHLAARLGVSGTVRNLPDGSVEVVAAGTADQIRELRQLLERGPAGAVVEAVTEFEATEPVPTGFRITR